MIFSFSIQHFSVAKEEDQIDSLFLDPALVDAVGRSGCLRRGGGLESEEAGDAVLDAELRRALLPELLIQLDERALVDLLTQRDRRTQIAGLGRGRDLEQIEVERLADRLAKRGSDESGRDPAGG